MPGLISRFLIRSWLSAAGSAIAIFTAFVVSAEVFEMTSKTTSLTDALSFWSRFVLYRVPALCWDTVPLGCLLGSLLWGVFLKRNGEWVGLLSLGFRPRRIIAAGCCGAVLVLLLFSVLLETVAPPASLRLNKLLEQRGARWDPLALGSQIRTKWSKTPDGFLKVGEWTAAGNVGEDVEWIVTGKRGRAEWCRAAGLRYGGGQGAAQAGKWTAEKVRCLKVEGLTPKVREMAESDLGLTQTPAELMASLKSPGTMSSWELFSVARVRDVRGFESRGEWLTFFRHLFWPLLCLALSAMAIWLHCILKQLDRVTAALGLGVVGILVYEVLNQTSTVWVKTGILSPVWCALLPVLGTAVMFVGTVVWDWAKPTR